MNFFCRRDSSEEDVFEISTNHPYFCLQCLAGNQILLNLLTGWVNLKNYLGSVHCAALPASHMCPHTYALPCALSVLVTFQ